MNILKRLFGNQSEKSNETKSSTLVENKAVMFYTIAVDRNGIVHSFCQCDVGRELDFGILINQLVSGIYNEEITNSLFQIFPKESYDKIIAGVELSASQIEAASSMFDDSNDDLDDGTPVIMPSQVFIEIKKT